MNQTRPKTRSHTTGLRAYLMAPQAPTPQESLLRWPDNQSAPMLKPVLRPKVTMLHPIYATLLQRPDLVADHLLAYTDLLQLQSKDLGKTLRARGLAWLIAIVGAALSLVFAGTALMLALLLDRFHPALVLLPAGCALLAWLAGLLARRRLPTPAFEQIKAQWEQDLQALRSLG